MEKEITEIKNVQQPLNDENNVDQKSLVLDAMADIDLAQLSYEERLDLAHKFTTRIAEQNFNGQLLSMVRFVKHNFDFLRGVDYGKIMIVARSSNKWSAEQQINVMFACLLFYIFSNGKYPQDYWEGATNEYSTTLHGAVATAVNNLSARCKRIAPSGKIDDALSFLQKEIKRQDVEKLLETPVTVGMVKIYELLWESVVKKYGNYRPALWLRTLNEFRNKKYQTRSGCEYKIQLDGLEMFATSYECRQDKPNHTSCEDCCEVIVLKDTPPYIWLAVVADGVGSSINSALGSQLVISCLAQNLRHYLTSRNLLNTKRVLGNKERKITDDEWAKLMYYIRFSLAKETYKSWEMEIMATEEFASVPNAKMEDFTTTLQFAFGCEKFVACGKVGDGGFFVKKREQVGSSELKGEFHLVDGVSGVTQTAVFTVASLRSNPTAMQVQFFDAEEITDIFITTDGAESIVGERATRNSLMKSLDQCTFEERCAKLDEIAAACSDYNDTQFGSGDDSTVVHVRLTRLNKQNN